MRYIILILAIAFFLVGCSDDPRESDWTIMVYMAADNGLSSQALEDINEMEAANITGDIRVIVQVDWNEYSDYTGAQRFQIRHDDTDEIGSDRIDNIGEIDSGDWHELSGFVNWATNHYPAKKYALVIWSHGDVWYRDGSLEWICSDDESYSHIGVRTGDFYNAMSAIRNHMDILMFDACEMQSLEVMGETAGKVHYIIGSNAEINADGFPFDETLELWNTASDSRSLSEAIVDTYVDSYRPGGSQYGSTLPITCSVADYQQLQALQDSLSLFVDTWKDSASTDVFHDARQECDEYGSVLQDIDIRQFFTILHDTTSDTQLARDTQTILDQIDALFYHSDQYNLDDGYDVSGTIWLTDNIVILHNLSTDYLVLHFSACKWLEFLYAFHGEEFEQ